MLVMNFRRNLYRYCILFLLLVAPFNLLQAQDLLAKQAPIDVKLRAIDSLALHLQIKAEQAKYPAYTLYPTWTHDHVHNYPNITVPDSFEIDLRGFTMPTMHQRITSKFGPRRYRFHYGLDIKVYRGDTIRAPFDGRVRIVRYERRGYGRYIVIRHDNGLETVYGHLSKQLVKQDEYVKSGEAIGLGGNTGRSTGSHLHFEVRFLGVAINPKFLFDFPNQDIVADTYVFHKRKQATKSRYYRVKSGDSLSRISHRSGVSISRLCRLNGISRNSKLRIGQILRCS